MRPGDLAPDDPDLGAPLLSVTLVDEGNLLAAVEPVEWLARDTIAPGILVMQRTWRPRCSRRPRSGRGSSSGSPCSCYAGSSGGDP